jgi:hypothetical protein
VKKAAARFLPDLHFNATASSLQLISDGSFLANPLRKLLSDQ